jgi:ABC-type transporter Mla subunit MlaD
MTHRKRRSRSGMSNFKAGLIGIVLIVAFSYAVYTKFANPFANPYTIHATFASANGLQSGSLVRIAGVDVGKVTGVALEPGCQSAYKTIDACRSADVTMEITNNGLPLHRDATFAIRPRIFLEGNFFVDVSPGTPSAPTAPSGYTFPIQQGTEPVQFDQVLTGLDSNTRENLQTLIQQYGKAVKIGGPAYNRSIQFWLPAYKYTALVAHDALGLRPNDLSNYIAAQGKVAGAFNAHPEALRNLITNFNTTANAFAREDTALRNTVFELPRTLAAAIPAFNALNSAFPPLRRLAVASLPGVKSTGPMVDATLPFIKQLRLLVQPSELQGLAEDLRPTIPALARLTNETIPLMKNEVRPASSCVANVIYPWSQLTVPDSHFNASNGFPPRKVFVEAVDYLPGLAGESRNFDANGPYIRVLGAGGTLTYSLQPGLFGQSLAPLDAVQPQLPPGGKRPPYEPNVPCETQPPITNLSAPASGPIHQVGGGSPLPTLASLPLAERKRVINNALKVIDSSAKSEGLKVHLPKGLP